jgi:signal recognition particle GTPase
MAIQFKKATKRNARLRLGIAGPSGAGKTKTSLKIAENLPPVNPTHEKPSIAFVDTERGSASKYANAHAFDVVELTSFHPHTCIDAIHAAEEADYDVIIIDSLSHFWFGKEGELDQVDKAHVAM